MQLIAPFLEVIKSNEVDGPITGDAIMSVIKFMNYKFLEVPEKNAALAIQQIARAATNCLFDSTDSETDEVILSRILKLIQRCVHIPCGALLSRDLIMDFVQTCHKMSIQPRSSALLRKTAESTLIEIVQFVFVTYDLPYKKAMEDALNATLDTPFITEPKKETSVVNDVGSHTNPRGVQFDREDIQIDRTNVSGISAPFGVSTLESLLNYICSYISPRNSINLPHTKLLNINIINSIVEVAGETLKREKRLLKIVQSDLTRFLIHHVTTTNRKLLVAILRVCFNLFTILRGELKFQLEIFMNTIYNVYGRDVKKGDSHTSTSPDDFANREAALEIIVQLCSDPIFVVDLYVEYDCDLRCSNLFEKLVEFLNKFSHPMRGPRGNILDQSLHFLAMDGLIFILNALELRLDIRLDDGQTAEKDILAQSKTLLNELKRRKQLKNVLIAGAERFNQNCADGFDYLQKHGVLPDPLDAKSVAEFLRNTNFLDKSVVGEYMGKSKEFNVEVLKEYCKLFDFKTKSFIDIVREFLESFRMSGEAPVIERIFDLFSIEMYAQNPGIFENLNACFLMCMSVIMLNVEMYNPVIKPERRMTLEKYITNFSGHNGDKTFPEDFLIEIYTSIKENEIKVDDYDSQREITSANWKVKVEKAKLAKKDPNDAVILEAAHLGIYDELLFNVSWKNIYSGLKAVFIDSDETEVLGELMTAITIYGKLATSYNNPQALDTIINTLCERSTILHSSTNTPFETRFAKDKKAQIAAKLMFTLVKQHAGMLRESWKNIFNCLLRLKRVDLLPQSKDIDEVFEKIELSQEFNKDSSSSPFISLVNNLLSWTTADAQDEEKENAMKEICKNLFLECDIEEIIKNDNLRQYIQSLIK